MTLTAAIDRLRDVVAGLRRPEDSLHKLPDELAAVLLLYEDETIDPAYRGDIHAILSGAVGLATALAGPAISGPTASGWALRQISILCRVIHHLENRTTASKFGILYTSTLSLHPEVYATAFEASTALEGLRRHGVTGAATIVPITLTSQTVVRPSVAPFGLVEDGSSRVEAEAATPSIQPETPKPATVTP